jgi:PUA-domain protein
MTGVRVRNRARMRRKDVEALAARLGSEWGLSSPPFSEEAAVDSAEVEGRVVYLMANEVVALEHEGKLAPGVRGLLKWAAGKRFVTVDMGAVRFVINGADVMAPGVTDADAGIQVGDLVYVREERHGKPLAVGQALMTGAELKASTKGKGVKSLHFLGDPLWDLGHEEEKLAEESKDNA